MKKAILLQVFSLSFIFSNAQNIGIGTTNPLARLHIADSSVVFTGVDPLLALPGNPPVSGVGARTMWYAGKAAFRTGYIDGAQWNKDNVGYFSFASGYNTQASNFYATAMGRNTIASGTSSTALGYFTIASAPNSSAFGGYTQAIGSEATAMGSNTIASGFAATSMGFATNAKADYSVALGSYTKSRSPGSMVVGWYNDTTNTNRLFEIGNGTADNARANAFTVLTNGNIGVGTATPGFPLNFSNALGDKISLYGNSGSHYGFGIQGGLFQMHTDAAAANITFGYGSSGGFTERARIINSGTEGMELKGRLHLKNGSAPLDVSQSGGVWLYKADNSALLSFMGTENNNNIGFYGGAAGWGFTYDAVNSRVGIRNNAPVNSLDVGGLNNWDLTNTEGDMRVGNSSYRLKFGVALSGGGAGSAGIMQTGGAGVLNIGAGNKNIVQVNGAGNYINLTNITGGVRINGNAGTAGQVLQSNGNNAAPEWSTKSYFMFLNQSNAEWTPTDLIGIGVYSVPIPGMDNQTIFIPEASRVMANVTAKLTPFGISGTASGGIKIEIWETSTNTLKLTLDARGYATGYDGTDVSKMDVVDLNAGFHLVRAWHIRGHDSFSGDSKLYRKKLIMEVFPN